MSAAVISPGFLRGSLCPPPSKSEAHRLLIGACLTQGQSRVENIALSDDIRATIRGMEALGASAEPKGTDFCLQGLGTPPAAAENEAPYPCFSIVTVGLRPSGNSGVYSQVCPLMDSCTNGSLSDVPVPAA